MLQFDQRTAEPRLEEATADEFARPRERAYLRLPRPASSRNGLGREGLHLQESPREPGRFGSMIGASPAMRAVFDQIARVAPKEASVLVLGESGTGKELVAETVHALSRRRSKPLVAINCGAISPNLIESEVFGHERGSFSGADRIHRGHFERADGGTLFLDEINSMPLELQVRLLRVLESGSFYRVGGDRPIQVSVRIVAAAKPDLEHAASAGQFREDLLYRLKVFPIRLPPLRERDGDLALLAGFFLAAMNRAEETDKRLAPSAMERLRFHDWPGNVRELKHVLERAFILSDAEIGIDALAGLASGRAGAAAAECAGGNGVTLQPGLPLAEAERLFVLATLDLAGGNKAKTAEMLRIDPKTLYCRLREYRASGHWEAQRKVTSTAGRLA